MTTSLAPDSDALPPDLSALTPSQTIALFHTLQKQLAAVDRNPLYPTEPARQARRRTLRARLALIGLDNYQHASREGERRGGGVDSSAWVLHELPRWRDADGGKLHLLDVGAIAERFGAHEGLRVTSIDLHPEESEAGRGVIRADFFEFAKAKVAEGVLYDVVCLSLCVNFEGSPKRRGLMLYLAARLLREGGLLFLVLPRACVENSRYLDEGGVAGVLRGVGMEVLSTDYSTRLMRSVSRKRGDEVDLGAWEAFAKRRVIRKGAVRNNFSVCLDRNLVLAELKGNVPVAGGMARGGRKVACFAKKRAEAARKEDGIAGREKGYKGKGAGVQKTMTSNQRKRARKQAKRVQKENTG